MIIIKYPEVTETVMNSIKADMGDNEAPLLNAPGAYAWAHRAQIVMGNKPRGDATPTWYTPANPDYKTSAPWDAIGPWFVIYPGTSHAATNVRVKLSGIKVYVLKVSDGKWVRIDSSDGLPVWAANWNFNMSGSGTLGTNTPRTESDGKAFKLRPEFYPIHGGTTVMSLTAAGVDPADIALVFTQIKSQLVLDDESGVDDRASAQILVSIGADYYLETTTRVSDFSPTSDAPIKAVGGSRFGLVKATQRNHYYSTINPPGAEYPTISAYTTAGGVVALPVADFEAKFSPLMLL